jgi:hypothetical protein
LEVLLAVERDGLGLDFALFDVDFVAAEDDGDVFADADEVTWEMVSWSFGKIGGGNAYGASWARSCK